MYKEQEDVNVVELIHEDFDKAGDDLLSDAKEIISKTTDEEERRIAEKLETFGFGKSKPVVEVKHLTEAKKLAKDTIELLELYKKEYPNHKFITHSQVKDICIKYGLVFGNAEWFIGDIPEKNKIDIANFELKEEHKDQFRRGVKVVGDKEQFETRGNSLTLNEGWELKPVPDDPIVLHPIQGGYLVVTKWGKEEDIEELK